MEDRLDWLTDLRTAYWLRWRRRDYLWRAWRARRDLTPVADRSKGIGPDAILCFCCIRNELPRLPHFLEYHRGLGVEHFLFVANDDNDGGAEFLAGESDCSVWRTEAGYKAARFGMDWIGWLLARFGSGHWCLTLDADELLVYPHHDSRGLRDLAQHLESEGRNSFGALTVDLYPEGRLGEGRFEPGDDPLALLRWFDPGPYRRTPQPHLKTPLFQGGVRDRLFFGSDPRRAPTMNKVPFVKWHWRYAYRNSTHSLLPPRLNRVFSEAGTRRLSGALLHTKFLPQVTARSAEEKARGQHFARSELHAAYYDTLANGPVLWSDAVSRKYEGWRQLREAGLLDDAGWH